MNYAGSIQKFIFRLPSAVALGVLAVAGTSQPAASLSWPGRVAVGGICFGAWLLLSRWEARREQALHGAAKRAIELLCQFNHCDLGNAHLVESLPALPESNPWHTTLARIRRRLVDCGARADELEHAYTSCEVRLRRLENESRRMRDMLERIPDPVLAINQYDEVSWANGPAQAMFGFSLRPEHLLPVETAIACPPLVQMLTETRRRRADTHRVGEFTLSDSGGEQRWFRMVCRTLPEEVGGTAQHGAVAILTDISQETEIQKRHAEFVAAAAHEMKTPLSSIRAYVELLQDGEVDDAVTQEEFWNVIQAQVERLQRLIENLLNLARIEAGVVKVEKQLQSLNEVLDQAYGVVQPAAEQKSLQYVRDLSPMYLGVLADRDMLLQATINLLSNAVKYTAEGGMVTLRSRMDENAAVFEVQDTGVGLSSSDCERIFEKFYRVKKDQRMASGTGLGLPLARHIVEDVHGGKLTVTSQEGVGSVFRVTLPVACHGRN